MNKKIWLLHSAIVLVIFLIGFGPLLATLAAGTVASMNGCELHEGFVNPCLIGGVDYGETLYSFGVLGWLSLGTIPIAAMLFLAYLLIVLVVWLVRKRKQAAPGM